ncbi:hypothetical protein ACIA5C_02275 [Actinoplanes sp. NPDC051343]|uniref:hypothetical protein n=1 Tax=Actinoplanes sp. NPDC051343 TaxID=3363906 RepID=UPI0037A126F6
MTANALTGVRAMLHRPVPAFRGRDLHDGAPGRLGSLSMMLGLRRRVAAFDGDLSLTSPVGGPTVLHVELPCA